MSVLNIMSRFRSPPEGGPVVRLVFSYTTDQATLYCHAVVLGHWFGVLKSLLEDIADKARSSKASRTRADDEQYLTILLDDEDCTAFEQALSFIYPTLPLPSVDWENAEPLLLLADKYDCADLKEQVAAFLRSNLTTACSGDNCFKWLRACSKTGLPDIASACIKHIVQHSLKLPPGLLASLRVEQAQELCCALQSALHKADVNCRALQGKVAKAKVKAALLHRAALPTHIKCSGCQSKLFSAPTAVSARYCLYCGKPTGMELKNAQIPSSVRKAEKH